MSSSPTSFIHSARLIAVWTLASRVTGLVRDILLNAAFGQGWVQDAFNFGFQIPNLFRRLFGEGALSAVFVPTFSQVLQRDGAPAAWSLLGRVLARLTIVLLVIALPIEATLLACRLLRPLSEAGALQVLLTGVMLPFMVSICLVALFSSLLNCLGVFGAPAAMPIVLNLCMIAGILSSSRWLGDDPRRRVIGVAVSVLAAGLLQLLLLWPILRRAGVRMPWSLERGDDRLREMLAALIPVMLGQGVLALNSVIDSLICTTLSPGAAASGTISLFGAVIDCPLRPGALTAITNAQRLYQFPLGVLAISLATAALPAFSRFAAAGDVAGLRGALGRALRLALFEGLPCGVMLFVLAEPIVRLLFQYGHYTADHSARAAAVLRWYGLGVAVFSLNQVVLRGFYSLKDTRTPMWIGIGAMLLNVSISLSLLWIPTVREQAFGISTTISTLVGVCVGLWLLRGRMGGRVGARALAASAARTLACTLAAAAAAAWLAARSGATGTAAERAIAVGVPLGAAVAAFLIVARMLRMEELFWLTGREKASVT